MPTTDIRLELVAPATLTVHDQAREDATPDAELIASVKAHGIIQPPVVEPAGDGYVIVTGHRRVGAAIAAGLDEITVIVRATPEGDEALTLERQIVENERRRQLTARELVAGYKKLELFGRTPADIARELGETTDRVKAGLKVARAEKLSTVLEDDDLDLLQLADIAEFEDDKKVVAALTDVARINPSQFHVHVERARKSRTNKELATKLTADLKAGGVKVLKSGGQSSWWSGSNGKGRTLENGIYDADGTQLTDETHATCPGHAAIVYDGGAWGTTEAYFVCSDWEANGHRRHGAGAAVDVELEKRRAEEKEALARKNANTTARRTWIHEHLSNGRLRPTALHFDALADALEADLRGGGSDYSTVVELLTGTRPPTYAEAHQAIESIIANREYPPLRLVVAAALASLERDYLVLRLRARHLERLAEWGYTLTDIDQNTLELRAAEITSTTAALAEDNAQEEDDE